MKYADSKPEKEQVLVLVTNPMVWSKTEQKDGEAYDDSEFEKRVPVPKYQNLMSIE